MVIKKVSRPNAVPGGGRSTRPAAGLRRSPGIGRTAISSTRGGRPRSHSLAPAHVGDLGAAALLVMGIVGVALVIAGLAMAVQGITIANEYASSPPPNIAELGMPEILGGSGLIIAGVAEVATALLVLFDRRQSRLAAIAVNVVLAGLALVAAVLVFTGGGRDVVMTTSLLVVAALLALAAAALGRRR